MVTVSTANNADSNWPYGSNIVAVSGGNFADQSRWIMNTNDPRPGGGWNGRRRKVGIVRRGNLVQIQFSNWNSDVFNPVYNMTLDLTSNPIYNPFLGPQSYGYANYSQSATTYHDIYFDGGERMDAIVDIANNRIFTYSPSTGWVPAPNITPHDIYGAPRTLIDSSTGTRYVLNVDGTVTII